MTILIWLCSVIVGAAAVLKAAHYIFTRWVRPAWKALQQAVNFVREIHSQLQHNGGSSIRDKIESADRTAKAALSATEKQNPVLESLQNDMNTVKEGQQTMGKAIAKLEGGKLGSPGQALT